MPSFHLNSWQGPRTRHDSKTAADVLRQPPSFTQWDGTSDPYDLHTRANREHTVCFTGHRMLSHEDDQAFSRLDVLLKLLYEQGYRDFLCGGALGFDQVAAEHVIALRGHHPDVRLIFCLPCADQSSRWRTNDCHRYERLLYASDETRVLSPRYYDGCMQVRNAYMVDRSYLCIAYMKRLSGGTLTTVRYAVAQDVPVINIAVPGAVEEYAQAF